MNTRADTLATSAASEMMGLSLEELRALIRRALDEDLSAGDLTTELTIPSGTRACGAFVSQEEFVVTGLAAAAEVFRALEPAAVWQSFAEEGAVVKPGTKLAEVRAAAEALLGGERVALNLLQHLSGIASFTRRMKEQLAGLKAELLDTRKTTPGLRALEKYAVRVGGGRNHRMSLGDGVLIKNNHVRLAGGVAAAVRKARVNRPPGGPPIEVEVANAEELEEAIVAGADWVLLDNMTPGTVRQCVALAAGRVRLEVSGGVTAANVRAYGESGVDFISVGALTHSAPAAKIHFLIEPAE